MRAPYVPIALTGHAAPALLATDLRIVISGASGWLGMATLEMLSMLLGKHLSQRVKCFGSIARDLRLIDGTAIQQQPLLQMAELPPRPTVLLHYAFLTRDKVGLQPLTQYIADNRAIAAFVEQQAKRMGVSHAFIASSGAVYGRERALASDMTQNPYGVLKLEDELRFTRWADACKAKVTIARVFNLSGPYVNKTSTYALSALILDALASRPMAIRAAHPVIRSYAAVAQVVSVAIGALLTNDFHMSVPWDSQGDQDVELDELARLIARELNSDVDIRRPPVDTERVDRYVGDGSSFFAMTKRLGVSDCSLEAQVLQTSAYLRELNHRMDAV